MRPLHFHSAPSGRMFQRVKVPNPPDSGKDIAKSKGVPGNWESEGSSFLLCVVVWIKRISAVQWERQPCLRASGRLLHQRSQCPDSCGQDFAKLRTAVLSRGAALGCKDGHCHAPKSGLGCHDRFHAGGGLSSGRCIILQIADRRPA